MFPHFSITVSTQHLQTLDADLSNSAVTANIPENRYVFPQLHLVVATTVGFFYAFQSCFASTKSASLLLNDS